MIVHWKVLRTMANMSTHDLENENKRSIADRGQRGRKPLPTYAVKMHAVSHLRAEHQEEVPFPMINCCLRGSIVDALNRRRRLLADGLFVGSLRVQSIIRCQIARPTNS